MLTSLRKRQSNTVLRQPGQGARLMQERLAGLEKSSEDLSQQHRKELSRLEAALAGAEAAKNNLSKQQAQHSTAGESDLQAAHAAQAEADARAASLQRQIDTLRAQAAASRSGLQDEANSLKVLWCYFLANTVLNKLPRLLVPTCKCDTLPALSLDGKRVSAFQLTVFVIYP